MACFRGGVEGALWIHHRRVGDGACSARSRALHSSRH